LKTPIIGPSAAFVVSSWIDMLAGLSNKYIFNTPPGFCANAAPAVAIPMNSATAAASVRRSRLISKCLPFGVRGQ